jgi:hypothetical protein
MACGREAARARDNRGQAPWARTPAWNSREPFDTPWAQARRGVSVAYRTQPRTNQSTEGDDAFRNASLCLPR